MWRPVRHTAVENHGACSIKIYQMEQNSYRNTRNYFADLRFQRVFWFAGSTNMSTPSSDNNPSEVDRPFKTVNGRCSLPNGYNAVK